MGRCNQYLDRLGDIVIPLSPVYPAEDDPPPKAGSRMLLPVLRACVFRHRRRGCLGS